LRLSHTPHHIIRATLEGLACELGRYLRMMRRAGVAVRRIVMCGGAASGCATPQIIANITALPVACTTEGPTSALGAAMIARGLLEPEAALAEISGQMKPPVRLVEPDENSEFYHELFEEYVASLHVVS
ncbi:MAG: hypothetical protein KAU28_02005, partial [Phycisphaerae bacterium]|nr:hypothetical protein [Phycisphaerae bacterium]